MESQFYLGRLYDNSWYEHYTFADIEQDSKKIALYKKEAFEWYKKAAEQGHRESQYQLGSFYYLGATLVEADTEKAINWLQKAAEQGHTEAQYVLGTLYYYADDIPKDINKACYYLKKAARSNYDDAKELLYKIKSRGY